MELNDIIVELLGRIKVLEKRVAALESRLDVLDGADKIVCGRPPFPTDKISRKYRPLAEKLYETWEKKIELNYEDINEILGFPLPSTASSFPQSFWANTKTHSYASCWLELGYKAKAGADGHSVIFEKDYI